MNKRFVSLLAFFLVATLALSSCKMLKGDPRKNCNHPKHGDYMLEKQMKKLRKKGIGELSVPFEEAYRLENYETT